MIRFVLNSFLLQVVFRVISSTINYVCYVKFFQHLFISCNNITAQVHKPINYLWTDSFVKFIFILFSRGTFKIKILIVQLIRCYFERIYIPRGAITLSLNLGFVMITTCDGSCLKIFLLIVLNTLNVIYILCSY